MYEYCKKCPWGQKDKWGIEYCGIPWQLHLRCPVERVDKRPPNCAN